MAHDVFISYSSKDKPIADAVCATLEQNHIRCWIAPRDILPGVDYGQALATAIKNSQLLVLVLSANSNISPQVMREVERAVSNGVAIVPFRIEDIPLSASLEYYLSGVHWLDAITPPFEQHLGRLVETVNRILGRTGESGANPPADVAAFLKPVQSQRPRLAAIPRRRLVAGGAAAVAVIAILAILFALYRTGILPAGATRASTNIPPTQIVGGQATAAAPVGKTTSPGNSAATGPTLTAVGPTLAANWAVDFTYAFPASYWPVGTHQYAMITACPDIPDLNKSFTNSFQVADSAPVFPDPVYLRINGLFNYSSGSSAPVAMLNPRQATKAGWTVHDATRPEIDQVVANCKISIVWDGGAPQELAFDVIYRR